MATEQQEVAEGAPPAEKPQWRPYSKEELIARQCALHCATDFAVSRPEMKSADIIALACNFQKWVLYGS